MLFIKSGIYFLLGKDQVIFLIMSWYVYELNSNWLELDCIIEVPWADMGSDLALYE